MNTPSGCRYMCMAHSKTFAFFRLRKTIRARNSEERKVNLRPKIMRLEIEKNLPCAAHA
jgi:hypothetical protein